MSTSPYPTTDALITDLQRAAIRSLLPDAGTIRDVDTYRERVVQVRARIEDETYRIAGDVAAALTAVKDLDAAIKQHTSLALLATLNDIRAIRDALIYPGFISRTPRIMFVTWCDTCERRFTALIRRWILCTATRK